MGQAALKIEETTLDDRIAAVFAARVPSDMVLSLIRETELGAEAAGEFATRSRARALDPALGPRDVNQARADAEAAAFHAERLQHAKSKLKPRLEQLRANETNDRNIAVYDKTKTERDRLATELETLYPKLETQLSELMLRVAANDETIAGINTHMLPNGRDRLLVAELVARGLLGFVRPNAADLPRIVTELRLPAFKPDQRTPFAWPR